MIRECIAKLVEDKSLTVAEAELKDVRKKKELAMEHDTYTFFCTKDKMLVKEILDAHAMIRVT
ncbi:MAG: hypothetical protein FGF48_01955 [Candidatus Brockarchaeota archaeon]|nr:hypothetical protein [Candidatus Brockarchaeota archaeon]